MKEALMRTHVRLTAAVLAVAIFGCLRAVAQEPAPELTTIEFTKDQQLSAFLDGAAAIVGRPILYDPNNQRIRGQSMSTGMSRAVPKGRELDLIRSILAFYEIVLIPSGPKGYEVLLAVDSRSTNNLVKNKAEFVPYERLAEFEDRDGVYITTSIPVRHIDNLTTLRTALSTMVSPAGIGRVHEVPGARTLVVMDFAPSVVAMARVVRELDRDPEPVRTETIRLTHAKAAALVVTLRGGHAPAADRGVRAREQDRDHRDRGGPRADQGGRETARPARRQRVVNTVPEQKLTHSVNRWVLAPYRTS
jgi:type II secretory pathway component GspD/PulD (secretin)